MKKMNFRKLLVIISAVALVFSSCKKDEEKSDPNQPVYKKNFNYTISGQDITFTSTLPGIVWFTNTTFGTEHPVTDGTVTVKIPLAGTYPFLCSALVDDDTYISDTFDIVLSTSDVAFLETGLWKALTGGPTGSKHWVLDTLKVFFHNPLDFYGDADAGGAADNIWAPWGGCKITDWMATDYVNVCEGNISFNGVSSIATATINGVTSQSAFTLDVYTRDENFLAISEGNGGGLLWDYFRGNPYNLGSISAEMADLSLTGDVRVPVDYFRAVDDNQFEAADLQNVKILHCSDSSLVIRVMRSREGTGTSLCWLCYNYIVAEYDYPEKVITAPINTGFDGSTLVGTWTLDPAQACGWVNWINGELFNVWDTRVAMMTDFTNWWSFGDPANTVHVDSMVTGLNAAADLVTVTFTSNSCTIHNAKFDQSTAVTTETDYTAGYTISEGVITFATEIAISAIQVNLSGTELHIIDPVNGADNGIWIGHKNADKTESSVVQLVKQ